MESITVSTTELSYQTMDECSAKVYPYVMRTTAGLLYYVYQKFGIQPWRTLGPVTITSGLPTNGNGGWKLYRSTNGYFTANSSNANSYLWEYYLCNDGVSQYWPLNAFSLQTFTPNNQIQMGISNNMFVTGNCPNDANSFWLRIRVKAFGDGGQSAYSGFYPVNPQTTIDPGGGCPFVFVQDMDSLFYDDNNILHRSEFDENAGIDITDFYKLNINPLVVNNSINLEVIETSHDYGYLDKLSLLAVDHLQGTTVGVTECNQIVVYDTNNVSSSSNAYWNSKENVTTYVNYNYLGDTVVTGDGGDIISASDLSGGFGNAGDSLALIISVGRNEDIVRYPVWKSFAGDANIYINNSGTPITKRFARRENNSEVIIPFASANSVISSATINWNRDFQLTYLASVPIHYSGYTLIELPLVSAFHPNYESALTYLLNKDNNYLELDSMYQLSLTFANVAPVANGYVRDYIFKTDGRYTTPGSLGKTRMNANSQQNSVPYKNILYTNYPNPFNPVTKINFEMSGHGFVKLTVYNVLGQIVKTLINEERNTGNYSIDFDGSNLPSGLYIYKIVTPNFTDSKKMVLIK